ncbi:serine/threonine protein kinase [Streptomyces sp. NBC_00663]|uniref:serine/threonine-protein kinase n=1 Tax=Streptomyces sp. NBC_00663 TaxID=2975801 RepID=UPI002E34CB0A|nr:serine/threonine-protein kinase [Streptomyces sp. NBC_00663]
MDALRERDPAHIGAYTLLARLGAGGMGQVYLARSPGGRLVAVKVIRDEITDHPEALARFRREVETVRAVRSAYTAHLIDASLDTAPYWLATEYVAGPTLSAAVGTHGPLPADSARRLFAALAEALAGVHAYGVTHRDLKPQNVLLSPQGPQLIDFGIARGAADTALTRTGLAPGTPGYTAPEVLISNQVGPAADVFALGATLAYAVSGRPPFGSGPAHAVSYRVVHEDIDVAGAEPGIAALIQECVAKEPAARPGLDAVIARCAVSSALAEDPFYGRLAADSVAAPSDLRAAVAAGLVPPGHGAPAAPAHRPTVGPGYVPTYVPTHAPTTAPEPPHRSRRRPWLVAVSVAAVLVAGSVVAWRMQDGQGGQGDGGAEARGGGTASASAFASGSATAFEPPAYIVDNKVSNDFWKLSTDPGEAAEGRGACTVIDAQSTPLELQYSATDADSPDGASGGNVGKRAKITFRFKYAEMQKTKPAPYYVSVGVKSPRDFDPETGRPYGEDVNKTIGATSRPVDIFTHWKEGGDVELVYPDDFQEHLPTGKAYDAVPVADDPGDWTVVFYHVTGSAPTDFKSIGCGGFHGGSS